MALGRTKTSDIHHQRRKAVTRQLFVQTLVARAAPAMRVSRRFARAPFFFSAACISRGSKSPCPTLIDLLVCWVSAHPGYNGAKKSPLPPIGERALEHAAWKGAVIPRRKVTR